MPSPLYSGAAVVHVGTMTQAPAFGWDYYEALADGGAVAGQGNGTVLEAVARGEKSYGMIVDYMAMNAKAKGSPVAFVFPSEGVSTITQPVAILKGTDNPDAAKASSTGSSAAPRRSSRWRRVLPGDRGHGARPPAIPIRRRCACWRPIPPSWSRTRPTSRRASPTSSGG